jgi:pimeloyl-ACP methyl ester carboxylesterase
MGFLVVALDAAGHGVTPNLPRSAADLSDRVDLTLRALDALGVREAVFLGHSMGGRMTVQLAAVAPERVLAAVLLNAAAGSPFDESVRTPLRSPRRAAQALVNAAYDAPRDPSRLPAPERKRYMRQMAGALARNVRTPLRVPGAYHSWMLANPRHGADMVRQLLDAELGDALRDSARAHGIVGVPGGWQALLAPDSPLKALADTPLEAVGEEPLEHVEMERLRKAHRTPSRGAERRIRWFFRRRKPAWTSMSGTADAALPAD